MIRGLREGDWPLICRVYDGAKPHELASENVGHTFVPLAEDRERIEEFRQSTVFVHEKAGIVLGFVTHLRNGINFLFVLPEASGQGIGTSLLQHALSEIPGDVHIWAMEGNTGAVKLYEKHGFKIVQRIASHNRGVPVRAVKLVLQRSAIRGTL